MKSNSILKYLLLGAVYLVQFTREAHSQTISPLAPGDYKHIVINTDGSNDYTRGIILLHEMYNGTNLANNYAIGTLTARRGGVNAVNRIAVAEVNTSSAYQSTSAEMTSTADGLVWKLKSCVYDGKKYLAVEVPYSAPRYESYKFSGWTFSTGQSMLYVPYETNGQPINQQLISEIQDYSPTMLSAKFARTISFMGNVGIGVTNPQDQLAVDGNILAKEIKVKTDISVPDYVFEPDYEMLSLPAIENYVKTHKHLPDIPSAKEIEEDGLNVAAMNLLLLKKVEELTLHLIEKDKLIGQQRDALNDLFQRVKRIEDK